MSTRKKTRNNKNYGLTIQQVTDLILNVDRLKEKGLLYTTDQGQFYTYRIVVEIGHSPKSFCKNLYIYGRNTNLLQEGQTLTLIDLEDEEKKPIATILADTVTLHPAKLS